MIMATKLNALNFVLVQFNTFLKEPRFSILAQTSLYKINVILTTSEFINVRICSGFN